MSKGSAETIPQAMDVDRSDRSLKIAIVYSRSPMPMRHADQMTVANLIEFLSARGHQLDLFALRSGGKISQAGEDWLRQRCRTVHLVPHSRWQMLFGMVSGLFRGLPLQVGFFSNSKQKALFQEALQVEGFDIVYVYYLRSAEVAKDIGRLRPNMPGTTGLGMPATFLALQLSQTLNTKRISENAPNFWIKALYQFETLLMARYETRTWKDYTKTVLIGPKDVEAINETAAQLGREQVSNFIYGAHGTNIRRFSRKTEVQVVPNKLVFSGVMKTPTNVQAVQWFVKRVFPLVRAEVPEATFEIVGREPTTEVRELERHPGVSVAGTVPDPAFNIATAQVCVNPMQAGGGMQNKLIEFLASEKPVVATTVANEGVMAPRDALSIADTPEEFAKAVIFLLKNPEAAEVLAQNGRKYVENHWTWEAHFLKLEEEFLATKLTQADPPARSDRIEVIAHVV